MCAEAYNANEFSLLEASGRSAASADRQTSWPDQLVFAPAHELARAIREREVSSVEVLESHLRQIALHNPTLNAIVTLDEDQARRWAREADAALVREEIWGHCTAYP
jgi:hypothetical protein